MEKTLKGARLESRSEMPIEIYDICAYKANGERVSAPHYHEYIEFLYADRDCDVDVWVSGETVSFKTGDLMVINSNSPHAFINRLPINRYICVKVLPHIIYSSECSFFDMRYVVPFLENNIEKYRVFSAEQLRESDLPLLFERLMKEWSCKDFGYELFIKTAVMQIFSYIVRCSYQNGKMADIAMFDGSDENVRLIQHSVEYINANYTDVSESQAAATVNMSYSHYSRQFKRVMGRSFREYINAVRISAAENLLLTTDMSVTDIALASGFATSSHFIESFKKYKRITPARYRQFWCKNKK